MQQTLGTYGIRIEDQNQSQSNLMKQDRSQASQKSAAQIF